MVYEAYAIDLADFYRSDLIAYHFLPHKSHTCPFVILQTSQVCSCLCAVALAVPSGW